MARTTAWTWCLTLKSSPGIKVNYTTFDSNESMYAKLKSGAANYDVIVPSDYMVAKMIAEGMLMPLNYEQHPQLCRISTRSYRNADYDPENAYTVPYMLWHHRHHLQHHHGGRRPRPAGPTCGTSSMRAIS